MDEALRRPRRKPKASLHLLESPLPVPIETLTGKSCSDKRWYYYFGSLQADHVSISRLGDLTFLYRLGFFGKGALSRSQPQFEKYKDVLSDYGRKGYMQHFLSWEPEERLPQQQAYVDIIKERLRQHAVWSRNDDLEINKNERIGLTDEIEVDTADEKLLQCTDLHTDIDNLLVEEASSESDDPELYASQTNKCSEMNDCTNESSDITNIDTDKSFLDNDKADLDNCSVEKESIVNMTDKNNENNVSYTCSKRPLSPVSGDSDKKIKLEDSYKLYECLILTFEEAFFLSYGLGCLSVSNKENHAMTILEMWKQFSKVQPNFIQMYAAYHHFRSKGWVVRFSKIYGLDFVLYQDGLAFHHASYCVIVQFVHENNFSPKDPQLSWKQLGAMCRINERAGKEVLFCYVVQPTEMTEDDLMSPSCIKKFKIMEVIMRRLAPEKFREEEK